VQLCNIESEAKLSNRDAALLSACIACLVAFVNVVFVAFSISTHFTSIHHLYDRYENLGIIFFQYGYFLATLIEVHIY
jgi:hypothetical protein